MRVFRSFEDLQITKDELSKSEQDLLAFKKKQKDELRDLRSHLKKAETVETEDELFEIEQVLSKQKPELLEDLAGYLAQQDNVESAYQTMINSKRKGEDADRLKELWREEKDKLEKAYHVNEFSEEILDKSRPRNPDIKSSRASASLIRQHRLGALNKDKRVAVQDIIANIQETRRKEITKTKLAIIYARNNDPRVRASVINDYERLLKREFLSGQDAKDVKFKEQEDLRHRAEEELAHKAIILRRIMAVKDHLGEAEIIEQATKLEWPEAKAA